MAHDEATSLGGEYSVDKMSAKPRKIYSLPAEVY